MIPLLAVQGGSLVGKDRSGPVTLTGSGALRAVPFDGAMGWLVEEATTNLCSNPRAVSSGDTSQYAPGGGPVIRSWVTGTNMVHPSAGVLATASRFVWSGVMVDGNTVCSVLGTTVAGPMSVQLLVRASGTAIGKTLRYMIYESGVATPVRSEVFVTMTGGDQLITVSGVLLGGGPGVKALAAITTGDNGDVLDVTASQSELKPYATTYADGSLGPGYTWTGTAHASASTRAESKVTSPIPSSLSSLKGSVYIRALGPRLNISSQNLYFMNIGAGASVSDRVVIRENSAQGLVDYLWISSNGAPKAVGVSGYAADTVSSLYHDWNGTVINGRAANGSMATGTRDAPNGSWGVSTMSIGNHTTNGFALNSIIGPVLIYDRPLTDTERATLDATPTALLGWSSLLPRVSGVLQVGSNSPMGVMQVGNGPVIGVQG